LYPNDTLDGSPLQVRCISPQLNHVTVSTNCVSFFA
jgi:hypothetical protein